MNPSKRYINPTGLALIRSRFGLSQLQLAEHLNVSRSLITMVERSQRTLPFQAVMKLGELELKYVKQTDAIANIPHPAELRSADIPLSGYTRAAARLRSHYCNLQRHTEKLEAMILKYQQTRCWIRMIECNLEEEQGIAIDWWKKQEEKALKTLSTCNTTAQEFLRHQIDHMESQAIKNLELKTKLLNKENSLNNQ